MIGITLVEESNYVLKNIEDVALSDIMREGAFIEELSTDTYNFDTNTFQIYWNTQSFKNIQTIFLSIFQNQSGCLKLSLF